MLREGGDIWVGSKRMGRNLIATDELEGRHMAKGTVMSLGEKEQFCFVGVWSISRKVVIDHSGKVRWTIPRKVLNAKLSLLLIKQLTFYYSPYCMLKIELAAVCRHIHKRRKHGLYVYRK